MFTTKGAKSFDELARMLEEMPDPKDEPSGDAHAPRRTNLELYRKEDDNVYRSITAWLSYGELSIDGYDTGPLVEELFGDDDYEYSVSLDRKNTAKLFRELGCPDASVEEKLARIKEVFSGRNAVDELGVYCEVHGIETSFFNWI